MYQLILRKFAVVVVVASVILNFVIPVNSSTAATDSDNSNVAALEQKTNFGPRMLCNVYPRVCKGKR